MLEMIAERSGSAALEGRRDLLTNLIDASMEKNDSQKDSVFTDRDLLGNIFIFLFAGKPSASSTIDFSVERWPRSRNDSKCFIVFHGPSGNPSRGARGAL